MKAVMKTIFKALIGGILVQVSIFLLLLLGILINIDELMPGVARASVVIVMVSAPGIIWLVREGETQPNRGMMLVIGLIIDIILYSLLIYVGLVLVQFAKKRAAAEQRVGPERESRVSQLD